MGFPTTVAPIYQCGKFPIYIDIDPKTLSPNIGQLDYMLDKYRDEVAGAIFTHTLGFPYDEALVREILGVDKFLISDNCDALGAEVRGQPVGSWSDIGTYSFFPAHHIFAIEGGALALNDDKFTKTARQYVNWGRDCHCLPGQENVCGKRFDQKLPSLPVGFDHKYTFTKLGYNLKMTEFQGALGYSQLSRFGEIYKKRIHNYTEIVKKLKSFDAYLVLLDRFDLDCKISPFGVPIILRGKHASLLNPLITWLERNHIATRRMFGGNLIRQPAFLNKPCIIAPELDGANTMLERAFWIGCHPMIDDNDIKYIGDTFKNFFDTRGLF